jgi:hypothetical protein
LTGTINGLGRPVPVLGIDPRPIIIGQDVVAYLLGQHLPVGFRQGRDNLQVACSACVTGLVPRLHHSCTRGSTWM